MGADRNPKRGDAAALRLLASQAHERLRGLATRPTEKVRPLAARPSMKPDAHNRRPIHHSPVFWIGIVLCLAAIAIYLWSDDLTWRPASGR
jgi:hypothetical protein